MTDLWQKLLFHLEKGNFTELEENVGGPEEFDRQLVAWHAEGKFADEPEALAEALSCACMLGRTETARYLIDAGVDPYAGMRTGLAGPHYAVSSGRLETVKMLVNIGISLEVKNCYSGTMLGQALWSAANEHKDSHADMIALLINAGAAIEPGTLDWWLAQDIPAAEAKQKVSDMLRVAKGEFRE